MADRRRTAQAARNTESRAMGEHLERQINVACDWYRSRGLADIMKTPEPMRPIRSTKNGRFLAVYTTKAQPDYKGVIRGGRAVAFEAKYTGTGRMQQGRVLRQQADFLDRFSRLGGLAFVICSFDGALYRVPWSAWAGMKEKFGRRYITEADVEGCRIGRLASGAPDILQGVECREGRR